MNCEKVIIEEETPTKEEDGIISIENEHPFKQDFWDDIVPNINNNNNNNNSNNSICNSSSSQKQTQNSLLIKQIPKTELYSKFDSLIKKFPTKTSKTTCNSHLTTKTSVYSHRCDILYEQAKQRHKHLTKAEKENNKKKINDDLSNCTFMPNAETRPVNKKNLTNNTIYERNKQWLASKHENLIKAKRRSSEEMRAHYQAKPTIHKIDDRFRSSMFNKENNIVNQPENYYYLLRQFNKRNNSVESSKKENKNKSDVCLTMSHYTARSNQKVKDSELNEFKSYMHEEILNMS